MTTHATFTHRVNTYRSRPFVNDDVYAILVQNAEKLDDLHTQLEQRMGPEWTARFCAGLPEDEPQKIAAMERELAYQNAQLAEVVEDSRPEADDHEADDEHYLDCMQ